MTLADVSPDTFAGRPTLAGRALAGGLALLGLVLWGLGVFGAAQLIQLSLHAPLRPKPELSGFSVAVELAVAAPALLVALGLGRLRGEGLDRFGFSRRGLGRDLAIGLGTGLGLMSCIVVTLYVLGALQFGPVSQAAPTLARNAAVGALLFALVGLAEEAAFRAYVLVQLSRAVGFWPAALTLGALFGLSHSGNPGENPTGLFTAGLFAVVAAYSFRRTGALWFAIGFHAAWDFAQSVLFGVPDSGSVIKGALSEARVLGPAWLTGGAAGPEGGVLTFVALAMTALVIRFGLPRRSPA